MAIGTGMEHSLFPSNNTVTVMSVVYSEIGQHLYVKLVFQVKILQKHSVSFIMTVFNTILQVLLLYHVTARTTWLRLSIERMRKMNYQIALCDLVNQVIKSPYHHQDWLPEFFSAIKQITLSSSMTEITALRDELACSVVSTTQIIFQAHKNPCETSTLCTFIKCCLT